MYRHFRLTPYTNHIKCGVQDSLVVRDYFTLPKSRYTPYTIHCKTYDRFKVFTYYLYTIYYITIRHTQFEQVQIVETHYLYHTHTIQNTHLLFPLLSFSIPIIINHPLSFFIIILSSLSPHHNKNKNNTLTDNIHSPITIPPSHAPNTPNTLTTPHL